MSGDRAFALRTLTFAKQFISLALYLTSMLSQFDKSAIFLSDTLAKILFSLFSTDDNTPLALASKIDVICNFSQQPPLITKHYPEIRRNCHFVLKVSFWPNSRQNNLKRWSDKRIIAYRDTGLIFPSSLFALPFVRV